MYLLDTCVLSETRNKTPDVRVLKWLSEQNPDLLFVSAVSIGELRHGIALLGNTKKARDLDAWLKDLELAFGTRILSVNATVAACWGELRAKAARAGHPRPPIDALIAATAKVDGLTLVTRNVSDMEYMDVPLVNPWRDE